MTVASIMILGNILSVIWFANFVFITEEVGYRCDGHLEAKDPGNTLNTSISNAQNISIQSTEDACRNPTACSVWVYDNPNSFVAEFGLACQDWKRTLVGSVHSIGNMVGLVIVGPLSDRFGRKPLTVITGVVGAVLGLVRSYATSYWLYVALELLEAIIGDPMSPLYALAIEIVSTESRVTFITICNTGLTGYALLPLIAWLIPYWRTFQRALHAPGLLFIILIYTLDESPRWLLSKGKKKEALKIIHHAAKQSKITIENDLDLILHEKYKESRFMTTIWHTLKSRTLLKRFAVCGIWWIACTFVTHGLLINSVALPGSKYVNFALSCILKLPSCFLSAYIMNKLSRRGSLILTFVVCAVFCIGQPFIPKYLTWPLILMYMTGKLVASASFNIIYMYTSELFPTHTRNSMHALCSCVGRIGAIMAPQTPLLVAYWSGLPTTLFGAIALAAGLATLLVPDTGEVNLPDTVCQAEALENIECSSRNH